MTSPHRFSIVTVCWNDLAGLQATGVSLGSQTFTDFEWIVIDGASSDGTRGWLEAAADVDQWVSEPDQGIYDAMNKGLERAGGEYVIFINSGDALADERVLNDVKIAADQESRGLIYGDAIDVAPNGDEYYRTARDVKWLWLGMPTQHQSMFFERAAVGTLRYDTSFSLSGDYAFVAALMRGRRATRLERPICRYALGGRSTIDRKQGIREDRIVRRRILGMPWPLVWLVEGVQRAHHFLRTSTPGLFYFLRYATTANRRRHETRWP